MEKIKQAVNDFVKENGNTKFTEKDLLIYLIKRIDDLPCERHSSLIAENKTRSKILLWLNGVETTIILTLFVLIFNSII